jgi:hypothetical protein
MTDLNSQRACGPSRRGLLRNGLLAVAGATVASVALPAFTSVAQAAIVDVLAVDPYGDNDDFTAQTQWWWCRACRGLFWSNNGTDAGVCPASWPNPHNLSGSGNYDVPILNEGDAGIVQTQPGWRYCNLCQGLFWGNGQASSHCPGNVETPYISSGPHAFGSPTSYLMLYGADWTLPDPALQAGWHYCTACQGLFWPGSGVNGGVCPVNFSSPHKGGGTNYLLFTGAP